MKATKSWGLGPKLVIDYSPEINARQYLNTARSIKSGLYEKNMFVVLPTYHNSANVIYFPEPPQELQSQILEFDYHDANTPKTKLLIRELVKQMDFKVEEQDYTQIMQVFPEFWSTLHQYIPAEYLNIQKIIITPTNIGSIGSVVNWWEKDSKTPILTQRIDAQRTSVFSLIVLDRLVRYQNELGLTKWRERIAVRDYLCTHTALSKFIINPVPLTKALSDGISSDLQIESANYLAMLGCGTNIEIMLKDNFITIDNNILLLTKNELAAMRLLIENRHTYVNYDLLADAIWKANSAEKFSLEAINKIFERIRNKLAKLGYPKSIIKTVRNVGYILE